MKFWGKGSKKCPYIYRGVFFQTSFEPFLNLDNLIIQQREIYACIDGTQAYPSAETAYRRRTVGLYGNRKNHWQILLNNKNSFVYI